MTPNERVRFARKFLKLTMKEFSDRLGMSHAYLSDIELGRSDPSYNFITGLSKTYKISADWIITGKGKIFLDHDSTTEQNETHVNTSLEDHMKLISQLKKALYKAEKNVESAFKNVEFTFKELEGVVGLIEAQEQDLSGR
jgi:transcriptional regulator with XRE-family HTH domain